MHGSLPVSHVVCLDEFYPDVSRNIIIPRPSDLFLPDQWTKVFARGLLTRDFAGKSVLEVGVGTGINMAGFLERRHPVASYIGTDICDKAVYASGILAVDNGWDVELMTSDLLTNVPDSLLQNVENIFACIPQVPTERDLTQGDNFAHYYKGTGSYWDSYGLGLNSALIKQATQRAPQAELTLNLSGRPGIDKLRELFDYHGRLGDVAYEEMVPQHEGTSVASLARMEGNGHADFEFYGDEGGHEKINAAEAERRRVDGTPVFHKIYVLTAQPR